MLDIKPRLPFSGPAMKLLPGDIRAAAKKHDLETAVVQAVLTVETGGAGGFLSDGSGRPRILFEAHRFSRETAGVYDLSHYNISSSAWDRSLYLGGAREYDRLAQAIGLNREAALRSASWGLFQILGSNHRLAGFPTVESYVSAMTISEMAHLGAFFVFCDNTGLLQPLRRRRWDQFASGYNGTAYRKNRYDTRLQEAYQAALGGGGGFQTTLRIGSRGERVKALQTALQAAGWRSLVVDGIFGRATEIAVEQFQSSRLLPVDGVAGFHTLTAMGLPT